MISAVDLGVSIDENEGAVSVDNGKHYQCDKLSKAEQENIPSVISSTSPLSPKHLVTNC